MRKLQRNSKAERQIHQQNLNKPHRRGDKKLKGNCKAEVIQLVFGAFASEHA